jgi:hypothetical protein
LIWIRLSATYCHPVLRAIKIDEEKPVMKIDDYRKLVHEDIAIACEVSSGNAAEEFLAYTTGLLINGEEFDDFVECHCEGLTRRKGNYSIDGYAIDETDGSCCIFIIDYHISVS